MSEIKTDFYDKDDGGLIVHKSQQVDRIIEHNKALKNEVNKKSDFIKTFTPGRMVNAGNVPILVLSDVMKANGFTLQDFLQGNEDAKKAFTKWFNEPNNPFNAGIRI